MPQTTSNILNPNPVVNTSAQPKSHISSTTVTVTIRSPEKLIFQGNAASVSSFNDVGPFDVLPEHENFISIAKTKIIIHKDKRNSQEFPIEKGIMKVKNNQIYIFLGVETLSPGVPDILKPKTAPRTQ